ncbi:MAG: nucleotidyltransferase family protein [Chloroflexota bacterium]|jgi:predicted nucleotidyltransferase
MVTNTTRPSTIIKTLAKNKPRLAKMGVRKIGLFGSFKRAQAKRRSDIDILVVLDKPTFDSYMEVKFYLEDLFGRKVDLVMEETIKPRLRPYILNEVEYA